MMTKALPNFLIAGAPKAGTSSVHMWIADHPQAVGSTEKETYYFVDPDTHMYRKDANITHGLDKYSTYFPVPDSLTPTVIFESTPSYLYYETALKGIKSLPTNPKCLFILREPAAQIYSLYQYFKNNWDWIPYSLSFSDYLKALRDGDADFKGNELAENALKYGSYVNYLTRWKEELGIDRMMVLTFDELIRDEREFTKNVARWVGLDPDFYESYSFPRDNETYTAKNIGLQKLNMAIRSRLPKGRLYNKLKSFYRSVNTVKPSGPNADEKRLILELKQEFLDANRRLATEFKLDLDNWI
jgi:hypothetical protein